MKTLKQILEMAASDFRVKKVDGVYRAYDKKTGMSVAGAVPNKETIHKTGQKVDSIFKMVTDPPWRGRGAMTAIHHEIEKDLGRPLHPSNNLTDDGFEFWKKYRPEAVKHDLRNHRENLLGQEAESSFGKGKIVKVGTDGVIIHHTETDKTSYVSRKNLVKQGHINEQWNRVQTDKLRGPHEGNELDLMLNHGKPAALIGDGRLKAFQPHIDSGRFMHKRIKMGGLKSDYYEHLIVHAGDHYRLNKLEQEFGKPTRDHEKIGTLLGYSKEAIRHFRNPPDPK